MHPQKILVFDNYDSFTYNLVHLVEKILHTPVAVYKNDEISLDEVSNFDRIILSPGPGIPSEAGQLLPLIREFAPSKSILGVCLGHQAIAEAFGGTLINLDTAYHGVASTVRLEPNASEQLGNTPNIFRNLPTEFEAGRYHSWIVSQENLPAEFDITARDANGYIMAMRHKTYDLQGVQFHPESVLTPYGEQLLRNWLLPVE